SHHGEPRAVMFRNTDQRCGRKQNAEPGRRRECSVVGQKKEEAGRFAKRNLFHKLGHRKKSALTQERLELAHRIQKSNQKNQRNPPLQAGPGEPKIFRSDPSHSVSPDRRSSRASTPVTVLLDPSGTLGSAACPLSR